MIGRLLLLAAGLAGAQTQGPVSRPVPVPSIVVAPLSVQALSVPTLTPAPALMQAPALAAAQFSPLAPLPLRLPEAALAAAGTSSPEGFWTRLARSVAGRPARPAAPTLEHATAMEALHEVHGLISSGRMQDALDRMNQLFMGGRARDWYAANPEHETYRQQGYAYYRHSERAIMAAYDAGVRRAAAVPEAARSADRGHSWRPTAHQEKDQPWCVYHALRNAASASVGAASGATVPDLVARARRLLDRETMPQVRADRAAMLEREFGLRARVRAEEGLSADELEAFAGSLGASVERRPFPEDEAALLRAWEPGGEWLLSMRFFHASKPLDESARDRRGHDYEILHHEAYLLGSFVDPESGRRLYMVQDSGIGATSVYTFEELRALTQEAHVVRFAGPLT